MHYKAEHYFNTTQKIKNYYSSLTAPFIQHSDAQGSQDQFHSITLILNQEQFKANQLLWSSVIELHLNLESIEKINLTIKDLIKHPKAQYIEHSHEIHKALASSSMIFAAESEYNADICTANAHSYMLNIEKPFWAGGNNIILEGEGLRPESLELYYEYLTYAHSHQWFIREIKKEAKLIKAFDQYFHSPLTNSQILVGYCLDIYFYYYFTEKDLLIPKPAFPKGFDLTSLENELAALDNIIHDQKNSEQSSSICAQVLQSFFDPLELKTEQRELQVAAHSLMELIELYLSDADCANVTEC